MSAPLVDAWVSLLAVVRQVESLRPTPPPRPAVEAELPALQAPLPAGWTRGLSAEQIAEVLVVEAGFPPIAARPNAKGYYRVTLPPGHPYANSGRWQYLHRYVAMRHLGRRLTKHEHAHHKPGASLRTTNPADLQVLEEAAHGRYHRNVWLRCGPHVEACGCESGCEKCAATGVVAR